MRAVGGVRGIKSGCHAVLFHCLVQVPEFLQGVAKTVVGVRIRRVKPDGFQHLDSCPLPVLAQQERDSQLTVQIGILSVEFERPPQMFNGLIQPASGSQLHCLLNQLAQLNLDFGGARCRIGVRVGSLFCLPPIHRDILAGTRRNEEAFLFFTGAAEVKVVVSRLNLLQNEDPVVIRLAQPLIVEVHRTTRPVRTHRHSR